MKTLQSVATFIDHLNEFLGRQVAWLALLMVLVQFIVVVMRYVFGVGSIAMQEAIIYMHSIMFMTAAGYTLLHGGHVRVDIFYSRATPRTKALIDMAGVLFFLLPVVAVIYHTSLPYVENSWKVYEGSSETSGIQAVFLLKSAIIAFCVVMTLQGLSMLIHALLVLLGHEQLTEEEHGGVI